MEDYKERLIKEKDELKEKFIKLVEFINSDKFYELSPNNKQVLKNQKIAMELYLSILNMRVFEDIDKIVVPDLGMLQMMGQLFSSNGFGFPKSDTKALEDALKTNNSKRTGDEYKA